MAGNCGASQLTGRLTGKTALVTGCSTGIGLCTVEDFVRRGARVVMACRNVERAQKAAEGVRMRTAGVEDVGVVVVVQLDLSSLASVRACAKQLLESETQINLLVNNAGVLMCPERRTVDGFERLFGTNHLGPFLLTCLLLPRIRASAPARIVTVCSRAYKWVSNIDFNNLNWEKKYNSRLAYGQSKLANVLFTKELARRLKGSGVTAYSLHPGEVATDLARHMDALPYMRGINWIIKNASGTKVPLVSPEERAQTTIYCAVSEEVANESGYYYSDCKRASLTALAESATLAAKLWEESAKLVNLDNWDPFTAKETLENSLTFPAKELLENE